MTTAFFCGAAFLGCLLAGNRSLKHGLLTLLGIGYVYGILRANFPDVWTYLMFDAGVVGLYASQLWRQVPFEQRKRLQDLRLWMVALMAWPALLFIAFPSNTPLVELVGLRANIFLLPFLLFGARLSLDDLADVALVLGVFNLVVVAVGIVEFFVGIEAFYPVNEVTEIIYKSKDLVGRTAYRIPATFSSAHAFAGALAMTLPLLVGAWSQPHRQRWHGPLLAAAIAASLMGIFMAAARTHMITAALLVIVVTFSGRLAGRQWVRWAIAIGVVGYLIAGDERFQRFTTLQDTAFLADRWGGSVNEGFFELAGQYPLGNGLAGGGTSVPYFLRDDWKTGPIMENEYARIVLEQGLPGLALWLLFIAWVIGRSPGRTRDSWMLGRRLAWLTFVISFASGLLGIGMFTSVPQTVVMLMTMGWFVVARKRAPVPIAARVPRGRLSATTTAEELGSRP
jgi:hypothetical protein